VLSWLSVTNLDSWESKIKHAWGINRSKVEAYMSIAMRVSRSRIGLPYCASEPRNGITSNNGPGSMDAMV